MKTIRIERALHNRISVHKGFFCTVELISPHGFYGMDSDGRPIYFMDEKLLHIPFGMVLDQPLGQWMTNVHLRMGDHFFKKDDLIYRRPQNDSFIQYSPDDIVDLKRTLYKTPPKPGIIFAWMQRLLKAVTDEGSFEGMGGSLMVIRDRFSHLIAEDSLPLSPTSRYALSHVSSMLKSVANGDAQGFLRTWDNLIGLGPGLTPSADDMLVGFLASQKMLSTPFWEKMSISGVKSLLKKTAKEKTTLISAAILCNALEGRFSEILYHVFEAFSNKDSDRMDGFAIKNFFKWGHSSGTDTLVGVVLGLSSLCGHQPPPEVVA